MSEIQGRISQVLGAVVDVEFPPGELPDIYDALRVPREGQEDLILEVELVVGNNVSSYRGDGYDRRFAARRSGVCDRFADYCAGWPGLVGARVQRARSPGRSGRGTPR